MLNRRQSRPNSLIIRNILLIIKRNIKIHPHENFFALNIYHILK